MSPRYLKTKIEITLRALKLEGATVHVTLTTDAVLRRANRRHRGIDKTTDVLSFPSFEPQKKITFYQNRFLGDVLVSLDRARIQAKLQKLALADEVLFLVIHSLLHLLGHDHAKRAETQKMQALESRIWSLVHA